MNEVSTFTVTAQAAMGAAKASPVSTAAGDPLGMLGHVAYLAVLAAVGIWAGARTYRRRLYV